MLQVDVNVGMVYLTYVTGTLTRVSVVSKTVNSRGRTAFYVRNLSTGNVLPKPRSSAALRPV